MYNVSEDKVMELGVKIFRIREAELENKNRQISQVIGDLCGHFVNQNEM